MLGIENMDTSEGPSSWNDPRNEKNRAQCDKRVFGKIFVRFRCWRNSKLF